MLSPVEILTKLTHAFAGNTGLANLAVLADLIDALAESAPTHDSPLPDTLVDIRTAFKPNWHDLNTLLDKDMMVIEDPGRLIPWTEDEDDDFESRYALIEYIEEMHRFVDELYSTHTPPKLTLNYNIIPYYNIIP